MDQRAGAALVAAGGFAGASLRYGVGAALPGLGGTLAANVVGSFVLGVAVATLSDPRSRLFLGTGLLSSFTTYSTFAVETVTATPALGAANVAATYALGVAAALAGLAVGRRLEWEL